jgi:hypothetical protein
MLPIELEEDIINLSKHPSQNIDLRRKYNMYGKLVIPEILRKKIELSRKFINKYGCLILPVKPGYSYMKCSDGIWEYNVPRTIWPLYVPNNDGGRYNMSYPVVPVDCLQVSTLRKYLVWSGGELICIQPGTNFWLT